MDGPVAPFLFSICCNARMAKGRVRNTELGDYASFCTDCGWARRYHPDAVDPPTECPACGGTVISACPECDAPIPSIMTVDCEACGVELRDPVVAGVRIRRGSTRLPLINPDA